MTQSKCVFSQYSFRYTETLGAKRPTLKTASHFCLTSPDWL